MGYSTRYRLQANYADCASPATAVAALVGQSEEAAYCLNYDGSAAECGKWYEHEKDLLVLSRQFPHLLLSGEGEEPGDAWKKYFLNGAIQTEKASMVIAPFDPARLTLKEGA